jgi:hypothetical protein
LFETQKLEKIHKAQKSPKGKPNFDLVDLSLPLTAWPVELVKGPQPLYPHVAAAQLPQLARMH